MKKIRSLQVFGNVKSHPKFWLTLGDFFWIDYQPEHNYSDGALFLTSRTRFVFFVLWSLNQQIICFSAVLSLWRSVYCWIGLSVVLFHLGPAHYIQHGFLLGGRKLKRSKYILWHVVVWSIWIMRNNIIFSQGSVDFSEILHCIKLRSWSWFLAKNPGCCFSFSDWCNNPVMCLRGNCSQQCLLVP